MSLQVTNIKAGNYYNDERGKTLFVYKKTDDYLFYIYMNGVIETKSITHRLMIAWNNYTSYRTKLHIIRDVNIWMSRERGVNTDYYFNLQNIMTILEGKETKEVSNYKYLLII